MTDWRKELDRLWKLRKMREENFGMLINCIQLATHGLEVNQAQKNLIWKIIDEVLPNWIDNDVLATQTIALEDAGLDVFRGLR